MVFNKFTAAFHKIKVFSVTVFLVLSSPVISLFVLILYLYRKAVFTSARFFRKDLDKFIPPEQSVCASDDLYGIPDWNVVSCIMIKGQLCLSILQNLVNERVVNSTEKDGEFSYPTLRQFPYPWGGYWWFKWDQKFDICNHVYVYEKARDTNRVWTENDLLTVQKNLLRKQWRRQRSPWEIFLINNFKPSSGSDQKCILFFRYHQCLSLGNGVKSWISLLSQELCEASSPTSILRSPELKTDDGRDSAGFCYKILDMLLFPLRVTFTFASEILEPIDENPWKVKEKELIKRDQMLMLEKFSKQFIFDIKTSHKVCFSAVTLAAVSGAVRLTLLEMGLQVPASMRVIFPIKVNRSDSLSRKNIACFIKLPLGIANGKERLLTCQSHLRQLQDSSVPFTNYQLMTLAGTLLPLQWASKFFRNRVFLSTGFCTNIHGPQNRLRLMGQDVEDFIVSCASGSGFVFTFLSYGETMRVTAVIDQRLVPSEIVGNKFIKNLYNELSILSDLA